MGCGVTSEEIVSYDTQEIYLEKGISPFLGNVVSQ